jgi:uncharacterized protein YdhG (YjbR/CyaY superfamily)
MAKTDYKTIDQYHKAFSGDTVQRMQKIRDIIHKVVPDVEETISYQIPCFKYNGYLIYYSAYPKHISLANPWSAKFLAHFKDELKNYKVSKSVIQIPGDQPLPESLIKRIIEFRKKENAGK